MAFLGKIVSSPALLVPILRKALADDRIAKSMAKKHSHHLEKNSYAF